MALGKAFAVAIRGLDAVTVEIEADISGGLPGVHLVGLPDTALQESRNRVRAAITFPVKSTFRPVGGSRNGPPICVPLHH